MLKSSHHLKEAGKGYFSHAKFAIYYGILMIIGGITSIIHGMFPILFPSFADNIARLFSKVIDSLDKYRALNSLPKRELPKSFEGLLLKEDLDRLKN